MNKNSKIICILDIGTSKIVALIGEIVRDGNINILGFGKVPSTGIQKGIITDIEKTTRAIGNAITEAETMAECTISNVTVSISAEKLTSFNLNGVSHIENSQVTQKDIDRAQANATTLTIPPRQKIFHTITQDFSVDDISDIKNPLGMYGTNLKAKILIISGSEMIEQNVRRCLQSVPVHKSYKSIELDELIVQPLASAITVLTEDEQELGVCCIDIGAGTTDISVFFGKAIYYSAIIPIAGDNITRDIALGLRTPQAEAERMKKKYGSVALKELDNTDYIEVPSIGQRESCLTERGNLVRIIRPRLEEIFDIVRNDLSDANLLNQIPAGIVLTGGTALLDGIAELAEERLGMSVRIGYPQEKQSLILPNELRNPIYSASIGGLLSQKLSTHQYYPESSSNNKIQKEKVSGKLTKIFDFFKNKLPKGDQF